MKFGKIEINNFRSVGKQNLLIDDLKKYNLIIGRSNSGKSNLLKILPLINDMIQNSSAAGFEREFSVSWRNSIHNTTYINEIFYGSDEKKIINLSFSLLLGEEEKKEFVNGLPISAVAFRDELLQKCDEIFFDLTIRKNTGNKLIYRINKLQVGEDLPLIDYSSSSARDVSSSFFPPGNFREMFYLNQQSIPSQFEYIERFLKNIFALIENKVKIIWAVRKVSASYTLGKGSEKVSNFFNNIGIDGVDAIDIIADLAHPSDNHTYRLAKYKKLNNFVSELLGEKVTLIPNGDRSELNVQKEDDTVLSIKSLGSSIEELTVIATSLINYLDDSIVAIEEPEVHLDPILQRKLIRYLKTLPNVSQFIFSSHSNVFINDFVSIDSQLYRTLYRDNVTRIEKIEKVDNISIDSVLDDLGVKASDLLQSNGIIWVEGPSERVYIKKWFKLKNVDFVEGIHYSIMFYGGGLRSNLCVGEEVVGETESEVEIKTDEFINLLKINRNLVFMMDSDKENKDDDINDTKKRIIEEISKLDQKKAMVWVTEGREVENYVSPKYFEQLLGIKDITTYTRINDKVKEKNKAEGKKGGYIKLEGAKKIAEVIDKSEFEQNNDLSQKLDKIIETIKQWNIWL